jgi:hypothetical protein
MGTSLGRCSYLMPQPRFHAESQHTGEKDLLYATTSWWPNTDKKQRVAVVSGMRANVETVDPAPSSLGTATLSKNQLDAVPRRCCIRRLAGWRQ